MNMNIMTNAQLVPLYNNAAAKVAAIENGHFIPLKAWKGKKDVLIGKIKDLGDKLPVDDSARTIREAAIELLCLVEYHEDRSKRPGPDNTVPENMKGARSVGIAYDEIIRRIKDEFKGCKTTPAFRSLSE